MTWSWSRSFRQCVTSFSSPCPSKTVPVTSCLAKSSRSGTTSHVRALSRACPRVLSVTGRDAVWPPSACNCTTPGKRLSLSGLRSLLMAVKSAVMVTGRGEAVLKSGRFSASSRRAASSSALGQGMASLAAGSLAGFTGGSFLAGPAWACPSPARPAGAASTSGDEPGRTVPGKAATARPMNAARTVPPANRPTRRCGRAIATPPAAHAPE